MPNRNYANNEAQFDRLTDELLRTSWSASPVEATILGVHDYDDTFGDMSLHGFRSVTEQFKRFIQQLETNINPSMLDAKRRLDYKLCLTIARRHVILREHQRQWETDPSMYPSVAVWGCLIFLLRDIPLSHDDLYLMLCRMREIPDMLATARENISNPSKTLVEIAIEIIPSALRFFSDVIPVLANENPTLGPDLLAASKAATSAFKSYARWVEKELLPKADGSFAIGYDAFAQLLSEEHCLTYRPHDLLSIAYDTLEETEEKMRETAKTIDPNTDWKSLILRLKDEHPPKETLLDAYRSCFQAAKDFVVDRDLATIPDDESLGVMWTPEIERSIIPYAAYFPPALFAESKSGRFWVTPIDARAPEESQRLQLLGHCAHSIPVIALHEAYPGHHLQFIRMIESASKVAKQTLNSLFTEGWALYCEQMMYDQGFYTDPRVRLFQLRDNLWRACRVIIDVGLHTGEMTCEEAEQLLVDRACIEEMNAKAEVKRYAVCPTQPMTYLIGKSLIVDLKEQLQKRLGSKFDLKAFHDQLISYGSIPPTLIAEQMLGTSEDETEHESILLSA